MTVPAFPTTPGTCGVMGLIQSGDAFATTILSNVGSLQTSLGTAAASLLSLPGTVEGIVMSDVETLANNLTAIASGAIASFISHLTAQFTNLINNLTLAVGQASAQAGLTNSGCGLPSLGTSLGSGGGNNACANMANLFGSITGLGAALVAPIVAAVSSVATLAAGLLSGAITNISAALTTVTSAVATVTSGATQITNMVTSETAALRAMVTDMVSFTAANALQNLFDNPCGNQVISAVGSTSLLGFLNA